MQIIFGIPIFHNQSITAINFIILLGKWYINNIRSLNKTWNFQNFLTFVKIKTDEIILIKTTNNVDPQMWEIDWLIAL